MRALRADNPPLYTRSVYFSPFTQRGAEDYEGMEFERLPCAKGAGSAIAVAEGCKRTNICKKVKVC